MRRFGVSVDDVGDGVSYGEAYDLVMGAMEDTSTPLYAAWQGWAFPASFPELVQIASAAGSKSASDGLMPWTLGQKAREREARRVTPEDEAKARAILRERSAMRHLAGFDA